jgi:hypothetical protein
VRYLVALYRPAGYEPMVAEDDVMAREIDALNEAMVAAGVRVFVGGLRPPASARSLRVLPDGGSDLRDGPYLDAQEHVGGFWVLDVADGDEALRWGRRAALACRAPVEVRPFH